MILAVEQRSQFVGFRDPRDPSALICDGYGISISVERGHLRLHDGIGQRRRTRRITRAQRTIRRIIVLGHTGHITLDAIRWCTDVGVAVIQIDTNGRVLLITAPGGRDDARLRRAQAAAPNAPAGLDIARGLLAAKIDGQTAVASEHLDNPTLAAALARLAGEARNAAGLPDCRSIEAQASNMYFGARPSHVACRFAERDLPHVPEHWAYFAARRSQITGNSPRTAADPLNAMLNYSYALAEAECRLALQIVGLDPGLGITHTDATNRDSLALDLLEPLRPIVERHVLTTLQRRHFTRRDFHETPVGACRILAPLTHELADAIPTYAAAVARLAEGVAHALARSSPGKITLTTPLSRVNVANAQNRGARSAHRTPAGPRPARRTCRVCGVDLYGSARQLCPTCWPVARRAQMRQLGLARAKDQPAKPSVEDLSGGWTLQGTASKSCPDSRTSACPTSSVPPDSRTGAAPAYAAARRSRIRDSGLVSRD